MIIVFRNVFSCYFIIILSCLFHSAHAHEQTDFSGIDQYIADLRNELGVPGVAVAIVENNVTRLAKGYGVANVNGGAVTDAQTLFPIASTTKAFTATALGILVDRNLISFDDPLQKYITDFVVKDDYRSTHLTIRDALSNRSGIERGDLIWVNNPHWSTHQVLHALRYVDMAGPYGSFAYNNILYTAAGEIIPAVTGTPWAEFVAKEIFIPLGMRQTIPSIKIGEKNKNIVSPHEFASGHYVPVPIRDVENVAPAGAFISSVNDMSKWCAYLNTNILPNGRPLLNAVTQKEILRPHTLIPSHMNHSMGFGEDHLSYAMGWARGDYRKSAVLYWHSGGSDGITTQVAWLPDKKICLVILVNAAPDFDFAIAVRNWILDRALGLISADWRQQTLKEKKAAEDKADEQKRRLLSPPMIRPFNISTSALIGAYAHPAYGTAEIEAAGKVLHIKIGSRFNGQLVYWGYTAYRAEWNVIGDLAPDPLVVFDLDESGAAKGFTLTFSRRSKLVARYDRKTD